MQRLVNFPIPSSPYMIGKREMESEREGRRRKIVDRGSDRMALITGRIKNLDDHINHSNSPRHLHSQSSPDFFFQRQSSPSLDVGLQGNAFSSTSLKYDFDDGLSRATTFDFGSKVQPQLRKCETNMDAIRAPLIQVEDKLQPSPRILKASNNTESFLNPCGIYLNFYTPKEISSCIIASENTRVLCSIVIALLVVLSNISLPRNIVKSKSVITSNPLYVLLLTDVAIVIGRLTFERRRVSEKTKIEGEVNLHEDGHSWGGAVKVLELGLVLHQTVRAIFIDCSFYAVIVICGLSLL